MKKLEETDRMHKEKYKNNLLKDIFHSSMSYNYSKVAEGIHSPDSSNITFALSMLNSIQKTYKKFEESLSERGDLNEYTKHDLDKYNHALSKLEDYLNGNASELAEQDAWVYHFYIQEQHKHFEQIAEEVDEDYRKEV